MDCSLPGSSVHGIFQARVLEWGAIAFSALVTREMQIKDTLVCHYTSSRRTQIERLTETNVKDPDDEHC